MKKIKELPNPKIKDSLSIEKAINNRRTKRDFEKSMIDLNQLSQLLWAGQGITDPGKTKRAAPSAGASYPFTLYVLVNDVEDLDSGIYKYIPQDHKIKLTQEGNFTKELKKTAFDQSFISNAAVNIVLVAEYEKVTDSYEDRGIRYTHMEAGHIAQNICLQTQSLSLDSVLVGSFNDEELTKLLNLSKNKKPVYVLSIGNAK
ncbi:MAG: SagB/ThcOx family dehydrogenase [Patescibacteria group bacterium]